MASNDLPLATLSCRLVHAKVTKGSNITTISTISRTFSVATIMCVCITYIWKCTLLQALRLCTARMAHRGSKGIALLFFDHSTRSGWGVSVTPRPLFTSRKDPIPLVREVGWAPGPVWTGAENLAPLGFDPRTAQPVARPIPTTLPGPPYIYIYIYIYTYS